MKYTVQITKALRENDVVVVIDPKNDIEALDIIRDLKDSSDDGWRMIPMRDGLVEDEDDIADYVLRDGAKAELHTSTGVNAQYDTIAEAVTVVNALDDSEGFLLIDEGVDSKIIYERPYLKKADDLGESRFIYTNGRANAHGRTDEDRI